MVETQKIDIKKTPKSRLSQINFNDIPFGKVYADHMFMADYKHGDWNNLRVIPYGPMLVSPATPAIHYGQSIFEGLKAYKNERNEALIFRPIDNWKRMNISAERMCMPYLPEDIFMDGIRTLMSWTAHGYLLRMAVLFTFALLCFQQMNTLAYDLRMTSPL